MSIEPAGVDRLAIDTVRNQFAPDATDIELEHFAHVCRRLNLDPYADQICLIGRRTKYRDANGRDAWRLVHRPQITVAGRRAIAGRTLRLRGIEGPVWCGPRVDTETGERGPLVWLDVWDDDGRPPYAARVLVHVEGWDTPANGTAKWSEFAQYTDQAGQRLAPLWRRMPAHMLGKVAESLALRRAFPEVEAVVGERIGGLDVDDGALVAEVEAGGRHSRPTASASSTSNAAARVRRGPTEAEVEAMRANERPGRCADCGAPGERTGHMGCQYPKDHDELGDRTGGPLDRGPDDAGLDPGLQAALDEIADSGP